MGLSKYASKGRRYIHDRPTLTLDLQQPPKSIRHSHSNAAVSVRDMALCLQSTHTHTNGRVIPSTQYNRVAALNVRTNGS